MFIFRDVAFILTLSHVVSVLTLYINNCLPHLETRSSDLKVIHHRRFWPAPL